MRIGTSTNRDRRRRSATRFTINNFNNSTAKRSIIKRSITRRRDIRQLATKSRHLALSGTLYSKHAVEELRPCVKKQAMRT